MWHDGTMTVVARGLSSIALSVLLGFGAPGTALAQTAVYELDPEHTTVAFLVTHIGYARVLGQFGTVEGSFTFDEGEGTIGNVEVTVETTSVTTAHPARDRHLRGEDFFDSGRHPQMRFVANDARRTGERTFEIDGQLELLGMTRPLTLLATLNKSGEYPIGDRAHVVGASVRGKLQRSDFGMTYGLDNGLVGDEVEFLIELEARRQ